MRLLLDTHALLWFLDGSDRLSPKARKAITELAETTFVSAASAWEVSTKFRIGKLNDARYLSEDFEGSILAAALVPLSIDLRHGQLAGNLRQSHKDPFDRMLIAQALVEKLVLVSNEEVFDAFGVSRLW